MAYRIIYDFPFHLFRYEKDLGIYENEFLPRNRELILPVITVGICVTDRILEDLEMLPETITYAEKADSEYLVGVEKSFNLLDVENEMNDLENYCNTQEIPFFRHSMDALNYFAI